MSLHNQFEPVIGLEIHAQLNTKSKIFCSDSTSFNCGDNENTSPVSVGMPGTLPVLNKKVVELSVKAGIALNCKIQNSSIFARKNYFYPDLPKGYQISQYDKPICESGFVEYLLDGEFKKVSITRAHMEEDAGKSTHFGDYTLINLNRSGIPLLEIVSGPDMRTGKEAAQYAKTVRQILQYLDVCDGNLEEGSLRCDCNVSVRPKGDKVLGTKVEIKNMNSFRFIEKAIEYEIERQIESIERGEKIIQETRLYDPDKNRTYSMRTKEDAQDYRYFPDPDLLPVIVTEDYIQKIKNEMPELPLARIKRFQSDYSLTFLDSEILTAERDLADYFEVVAMKSQNPKNSANWVMTELMREINQAHLSISKSPISPESLAKLVKLISDGTISGKIGKVVFAEMWKEKKEPETIISEKGLLQISDTSSIEKIISQVLEANINQVNDYNSGKTKLFGFFVGQIMKMTKGQANPDLVNKLLLEKLNGYNK